MVGRGRGGCVSEPSAGAPRRWVPGPRVPSVSESPLSAGPADRKKSNMAAMDLMLTSLARHAGDGDGL